MADKKAAAAAGSTDGLPEVDVLMKGLLTQPGVEGYMVFNDAGIPLKWTPSAFVKPGTNTSNPIPASVVHHASLLGDLTAKARGTCQRLLGEADGDLQLLRLRTKTHEIVVAPNPEATLVVVQKGHSAAMVPLVAAASTGPVDAAGGAVAAAPAGAATGGTEEKKVDKA